MADYTEMLPLGADETPYRLLTTDHVSTVELDGRTILKVDPEALKLLAKTAMEDIAHLFRPGHLAQLRDILGDTEATDNDRFVATELLKNANISAGRVLPSCQDTGTAIVIGKKGENVFTGSDDEAALAEGIARTYEESNLRYSQLAPLTMYQKTKTVLNPESLLQFIDEKIRTLGTAACPPYHLAIVIGGTSAEYNLKVVKLASARFLDSLPTSGSPLGHGFRDLEFEEQVLDVSQKNGIGAQFGGKYFCHDVRVIRLPRHGASCPIGIGVSCSADRQALGKITKDGVFLEQLEVNPAQFLPEVTASQLDNEVVSIDLNVPMKELLATLSQHPIKTRLSLTGSIVVARDIAHAKLKERIESGEGLPQYMKDQIVYYAGPAKTPVGYASGSFGPTTAGRMDGYVDLFQANGGSMVMLAKGNRSRQVTEACKKYGGFYLGSIGGPAAVLAKDCIKKVEVIEYDELGMEAIFRIDVENFPAFIVIDDKGNDFFANI